jgi:hypothetical protein
MPGKWLLRETTEQKSFLHTYLPAIVAALSALDPPNTCNAPPPCRTQLTHDSRTRGPEIELCIADEGSDPALENDWSLLPFMALSDGAHTYEPSPSQSSLSPQEKRPSQALSRILTQVYVQIHRGLLIFYPPSEGDRDGASNLAFRDLMFQTDRLQSPYKENPGCDQVNSAEGRCRCDG